MKIHLQYGWINLKGANHPYRNNLYRRTLCDQIKKNSLKIRGV